LTTSTASSGSARPFSASSTRSHVRVTIIRSPRGVRTMRGSSRATLPTTVREAPRRRVARSSPRRSDAPGGVSPGAPDRNVPLTIPGILWSVPAHC
jgi:hypothetical protein